MLSLALFLIEAGFAVAVTNPMQARNYAKSLLQRAKTDQLSPNPFNISTALANSSTEVEKITDQQTSKPDLVQRQLQIEIVQDKLSTHKPGALYQVFEPAEARRILDKVRFTYTSKHGSWLNMTEIEISGFERTCLSRRLSSRSELEQEVGALEAERNGAHASINWQFSCEDARAKLQRLYPKLGQVNDPL